MHLGKEEVMVMHSMMEEVILIHLEREIWMHSMMEEVMVMHSMMEVEMGIWKDFQKEEVKVIHLKMEEGFETWIYLMLEVGMHLVKHSKMQFE